MTGTAERFRREQIIPSSFRFVRWRGMSKTGCPKPSGLGDTIRMSTPASGEIRSLCREDAVDAVMSGS